MAINKSEVSLILDSSGASVINGSFETKRGDAINIKKNGCVVDSCIIRDNPIDELTEQLAHRDAIQIIPQVNDIELTQYIGAISSGVSIVNNTIICKSMMQGITCFDGRLDDITVSGNRIVTRSPHKIVLHGVLSGMFENNTDHEGRPIPVVLNPLRLVGGVMGICIYVQSCLDDDDQYREIDCEHVIDNRLSTAIRPAFNDIYLYDFDMQGYLAAGVEYLQTTQARGNAIYAALHVMAQDYGARV